MLKWFKDLISQKKEKEGGDSISIQNLDHSKVIYIHNLILKSTEELEQIPNLTPIVKNDLLGVDKEKFIGKINSKDDLVKRSFTKENASKGYGFYWENEGVDLKSIIQGNSKVVLLGNPGLGKSTELEQLSTELWNDQGNPLIPIHRNLRNFTNLDSIDSFIKINWRTLSNVIFVFDGIDEISDTEDFISKLETFILEVESKAIQSSFLISCRTNVFEDEVKSIAEFEKYYLEDLTWKQGIDLLKTKCNFKIDGKSIYGNFEFFIKNPYQIEIVSKYIKKNKKLPTNTAELWRSYVDNRLKDDSFFKLKKHRLNATLIKHYSKKLSLVNELMKRNIFYDDDILKIAGEDLDKYEAFKKNPLFDSNVGATTKFFEHRNIQEYFAALALSDLEYEKIIDFICIKNTSRTHPSLFNTITFLINLLPVTSKKFDNLINWIVNNEPELLFRSDSNRIDEPIRNSVFRTYFERECIEKTLWIDSRRTYEVSKIAQFADSNENFNYLLGIIKNKEQHVRVRYSAFEVLIHFKFRNRNTKEVLEYFLEELLNEELEVGIKCQILNFIENHYILKNDVELINKLLSIFEDEGNKEINTCLLNLIQGYDDIDQFSDFLNKEFQWAHNITPRPDNDRVIRGNKYKVEKLILKYQDSNNFLASAKFYFNNSIRESNTTGHLEKVADKCVEFAMDNDQFMVNLLNEIKDELKFHSHRNLLLHIIKESKKNDLVIEHLLENWRFKEIIPFVARILKESSVPIVLRKFKELEVEDKEYEYFRNRISNTNDVDLALFFEKSAAKEGVGFEEKLFTQAERDIQKNYFFDTIQENLNILFDKERLAEGIKTIFNENNGEISWEVFHKIETDWYEENGHWNTRVDSAMDMIGKLLSYRNQTSLSIEEATSKLEEDYFRYKTIKDFIKKCKERNWQYEIFDDQAESIKKWCIKTANEFDFNDVITVIDNGNRYHENGNNNQRKIGLIHFFNDLLKFDLPIPFLLGCIEFDHYVLTNSNGALETNYDYLRGKINDDNLFNDRIVENINTKQLWSWTFSKHLKHSLEQRLEVTYPIVRQFLSDVNRSLNETALLEEYIKITNDVDLLLECCVDFNNRLHWSAIDLLIKYNKETEFCVNRSIEYLNSENTDFNSAALQTLFMRNSIEAINYMIKYLNEGTIINSLRTLKFEKYNAIDDFKVIRELFDLIYNKEIDEFDRNDYRSFLSKYIANVSQKGEDEFNSTLEELKQIREEITETGKDLFHINLLIDDMEYNYYLSKSKPYEFQEALIYVNTM